MHILALAVALSRLDQCVHVNQNASVRRDCAFASTPFYSLHKTKTKINKLLLTNTHNSQVATPPDPRRTNSTSTTDSREGRAERQQRHANMETLGRCVSRCSAAPGSPPRHGLPGCGGGQERLETRRPKTSSAMLLSMFRSIRHKYTLRRLILALRAAWGTAVRIEPPNHLGQSYNNPTRRGYQDMRTTLAGAAGTIAEMSRWVPPAATGSTRSGEGLVSTFRLSTWSAVRID